MNIDRFGNTSAGTILIPTRRVHPRQETQKGELNMLLALGAGIHWELRARPLVARTYIRAAQTA